MTTHTPAESPREFAVVWADSLMDTTAEAIRSHAERRGPRMVGTFPTETEAQAQAFCEVRERITGRAYTEPADEYYPYWSVTIWDDWCDAGYSAYVVPLY